MSHIGISHSLNSDARVQALHTLYNNTPIEIRVRSHTEQVIDLSDYVPRDMKGAHISVIAEPGSSLHINAHEEALPAACFIEFDLKEYARVVYEAESRVRVPVLRLLKAVLGGQAQFNVGEHVEASERFYSRCDVALQGEGASFHDELRYRADADAFLDIERAVRHTAKRSVSKLSTRGIAGGFAKVIWRGNVCMEKHAGNASAFQRHDAILASPTAYVDASPILEIYAHDVSCKHGVSVQRVQPEQIFYFGSRGVPEAAARNMLWEGFLK